MTRAVMMRFPSEETHPGFDKLKQLAGRVGRTFGDRAAHEKATGRLRDYMRGLPPRQILYYSAVVMIVPPDVRAMATGAGACWAVASGVVNEVATDLWDQACRSWRQRHGDALFVVEEVL